MSAPPDNIFSAALEVTQALDGAGIPYALGGAFAYGVWAIPRATTDIDINVFVSDEDMPNIDRLFDVMERVGVTIDRPSAIARIRRDGMFVSWWDDYKIEVFVISVPFQREAFRTRVEKRHGVRTVWFLSAEAIAVFKLMFHRSKDLVDLERLVAIAPLDHSYVRRWIADMLGDDDFRLASWDRLVAGTPTPE